MNKKAVQMVSVLIALGLGVVLFLTLSYIFGGNISNAVGVTDSVFRGSVKVPLCGVDLTGISGGVDSTGDGYPDSCSPCVDVHMGITYDGLQKIGTIYASDQKYTSLSLHTSEYFSNDPKSNDWDGDGIPNICEPTKQQILASRSWVSRIFSRQDESDMKEPYLDPKVTLCKFWYSHDQCCAQMGKNVEAIDQYGEPTGNRIQGECFPHDERPKK